MTDALTVIILFAAWIFITKFLFPKMGLPTWGVPYVSQGEKEEEKENE